MTWTNFESLREGQKIYGIDFGKGIFLSVGMTVEQIFPNGVVIIRHDYGDKETLQQETKYLIKENP